MAYAAMNLSSVLPYQLSMVGYAPTMVVTGNGESGFDSSDQVCFIKQNTDKIALGSTSPSSMVLR